MTAIDWHQPLALMRDEESGAWRLFTGFDGTVGTANADDGHWLAGGIAYGQGLAPALPPGSWLGRFRSMQLLRETDADALLSDVAGDAGTGAAQPLIADTEFQTMVREAQALIAAGDIYQANLTFPACVAVHGHPAALFRRLWAAGRPPLAGLVHQGGGRWWLSLSPELFFRMADGHILARPMKGTARRLADPAADAAAGSALADDPKNRAENLMITDLLRNDLARVAIPGTVRVDQLFAVERYPSVHQMTSTVSATLAPDVGVAQVLAALFPCGSITGAPKIRAMQVIDALESAPRGIYCGGIGWIAPGGTAAQFNVAIRTLAIDPATPGEARLGLGSGIVADSDPAAEWQECLAKAGFLAARPPAALIETMRREADGTIPRLARHLDRLARSSAWLGWPFDPAAATARLAALPPTPAAMRCRLLLASDGALAVQLAPAPPPPAAPLRVALVPLPVPAEDWRLHHKSTDRGFYDAARRAAGTDEILFVAPCGRLTEGSFTSLFVERAGRLLTPAGPGLLPGILRAELLANGKAVAADLKPAHLAGGFLLGNSLRGLMPATLVPDGAQS